MWKPLICTIFLLVASAERIAAADASPPVDQVIKQYVQALGGAAALDKISSRQIEVKGLGHEKVTFIWQAPNKVLRISGKERQGFDGGSAWLETKRRKIQKLPHSDQLDMETNANPVRFAHLHQIYTELDSAPRASLDGVAMDVLVSPNHIGSTKLFFDASTHLLRRIEDFGIMSAYYKHVTEFSDYQDFDGLKLPTRIDRETDEPGAETGTIRLSKVKQNIAVKSELFERPDVASSTLGGKR